MGLVIFPRMLEETIKHIAGVLTFEVSITFACDKCNVEKSFSSMNFVNNQMRNHMGDEFLNHCLLTCI